MISIIRISILAPCFLKMVTRIHGILKASFEHFQGRGRNVFGKAKAGKGRTVGSSMNGVTRALFGVLLLLGLSGRNNREGVTGSGLRRD